MHGWCRSRRHSPGGSAYREGEGTGTGLEWQCVDGAGVGGTCLAAVLEEKKKTPALALERCVNGAGVEGTCLAAVFEGNERALALAFRGGA